MRKMPITRTLKEWCQIYGIKIRDPKGFYKYTSRANVWNKRYKKVDFREGAKHSIISIISDDGLFFLGGEEQNA
jgi:hypothetical protein